MTGKRNVGGQNMQAPHTAQHRYQLSTQVTLPAYMDLLSVLPSFPSKPYTHLLPSLERNKLTTVDLITLDTLEIAKRAHLPPADVRRLSVHVIEALHGDVGFERKQPENVELDTSVSFDGPVDVEPGPGTQLNLEDWSVISTLDPGIDALLDGGVPTGYLTEVTGERYVFFYRV